MAVPLNITPDQPVTVTGTSETVTQNLWEAVNVLPFDILDLELVVLASSGSPAVKLITGTQKQSEDGWAEITSNFATPGAGAVDLATFDKGFLSFVRWSVTFTATGSITFYIRGVGRRYGA